MRSETKGTRLGWSRPQQIAQNRGLRSACSVAALAFAAVGSSENAVTRSPFELMATDDSIVLSGYSGGSRVAEGITRRGLPFKIIRHRDVPGFTDYETAIHKVTIEMDRPMAAIGAYISVGEAVLAGGRSHGSSVWIDSSGYYGVMSARDGVQALTMQSSAPILVDKIEVRPMPVATDDEFTVGMNNSATFEPAAIRANDSEVDSVFLVRPPANAQSFELRHDGSFRFEPLPGFVGTDSFRYSPLNGGGSTVGMPATVTLRVVKNNLAPTFVAGPNQTIAEDSGRQTVVRWATAIEPGSNDELDQVLRFEVRTDNPGLFSEMPQLQPDGTLTYASAPDAYGIATVEVVLVDDGGTDLGGKDRSALASFSVDITPMNDPPRIAQFEQKTLRVGQALSLVTLATEVDLGQAITYSVKDGPIGVSINSLTGEIAWVPTVGQIGRHEITVCAFDPGSVEQAAFTTLVVEVLPELGPPMLGNIPDLTAAPGQLVSMRVRPMAAETQLQYFLASDVAGPRLNPATGSFTWVPESIHAGKTISFSVSAIDPNLPGLCAVETFIVRVGNIRPLAQSKVVETGGKAAMRIRRAPPAKRK